MLESFTNQKQKSYCRMVRHANGKSKTKKSWRTKCPSKLGPMQVILHHPPNQVRINRLVVTKFSFSRSQPRFVKWNVAQPQMGFRLDKVVVHVPKSCKSKCLVCASKRHQGSDLRRVEKLQKWQLDEVISVSSVPYVASRRHYCTESLTRDTEAKCNE